MRIAIVVFLIALLLITACFEAGVIYVLQGIMNIDLSANWVGMLVFGPLSLLFFVVAAHIMAKHCLYPHEVADLQVIGGVRYGSSFDGLFSGKSATWPFAKLLANREKIWLYTPWDTLEWDKPHAPELRLYCRFPIISPRLVMHAPEITIFLFPWHCERVEKSLEVLGYKISKD